MNKFEDIAEYNAWNETDKLVHLKASLTGSATYLLTESRGLTYEDMKEKLRRRYSTREQQERFKVELKTRRRRPDESLQDLCHEVERLAALAYPGTTPELRDVLGRDEFIDALNNNSLEFKVKERDPPTLAKALTTAVRIEALYRSKKVNNEAARPRNARQLQPSTKPDGAADQLTGSEDIQPGVDKLKAEVSRRHPPAQPPSKKGYAADTKQQKRVCPVATATPRQEARAPQAEGRQKWEELDAEAVSYTHLTLPTIYSV